MSVYILTSADNGLAKIGFAKNPKQRFTNIQTASPLKLELAAVIPGAMVNEKQLHERFSHVRRHGEWFEITSEISELICVHRYTPPTRAPSLVTFECPTGPLLFKIEAFLKATGMSATAFGIKVLNDPPFVQQLRDGRDPKMSTAEKIEDFMASYTAPASDAEAV